jgi:glycosyltransferase involved in cell wall biosynthesis
METFRFLMATTFYPPYHIGGDAVHVQYLAEALAARGHEIHIEFSPAAYRLKRTSVAKPAWKENGIRVHPIRSPLGRIQPVAAHLLGRSRSVARFHERLSRTVRPDVVHLHNISLLGLGVLKRPGTAMMLYTAHDYWARCPRSDLLKRGRVPCDAPACVSCAIASRRPPQLWRYAEGWRGLPGLDVAIAPSRFMAQAIAPYLACPVLHIPNFAPDENLSGAIAEPEDYFLYVGVLESHKGVGELAKAIPRLGSARVRVVGEGSLFGRLKQLERMGRVDVEGSVPREQLHRLYRRAKALLLPSIWLENAPLVAIEALSQGAPLLAARRGGLEEILHGGVAGRSFEPNADELLSAMERFERDGLDRSLRSSARQVYEKFYRPRTYVDRYLEIIRSGPLASVPCVDSSSELVSQQSTVDAPPAPGAGTIPSATVPATWNVGRR